MRDYVILQTGVLLRRLAYQVNRAAKSGDAESIHDLRVAIRRFSRCLRVFSQFYPGSSWKKIRHQLSGLMASAGAVRDVDIAMELLASESKGGNRQLISKLKQRRRQANRELFDEVQHWNSQSFSKKWRNSLGLGA
jgi:CHAD domain-containing protein